MSNATITGITQGENNYLWLSTPYGLNRFDGHSIKTYFKKDGLADNTLFDVYFDDNKQLWIETKKGVQTYNGHEFKTITNSDSLEIPHFKSTRIVDYDFLLNQPFSSRITDTLTYKSKLYVATFGEGLWIYEDSAWLEVDNKLGLFDIIVTDLFKDSNGQFWIASNHGLTLFSESEFQMCKFDTIRSSFGMLEYENALWICSRSGIDKIENEIPIPPSEKAAKEKGLNFIKLDGSVGIIGNGAGLVMSTLDVVAEYGGSASNFLDIGGGAKAETVSAALEVLETDDSVSSVFINIFGGITRCDLVAEGIVEATKGKDLKWPIVIRLDGTNAVEGLKILKDNPNEKIIITETMNQAAELAVKGNN